MKCEEVIWQILGLLDQESKSVQDFLKIDKNCVQSLISLDKACCNALVIAARDLLRCANDEQNEYKFQAVLRAIISRQQSETFELISDAFESNEAIDKETYLNYLCDFGDSRAVPKLIRFLEQYETVNDETQKNASFVSLVKEAIDHLDGKYSQ